MNKIIAKELLFGVADIFEKHNIKFYLDYGTLLGAIREKDFLSNDSDIDVGTYERIWTNPKLLRNLVIDLQIKDIKIKNFWDNTVNSIMFLELSGVGMDIYHKVRTDEGYIKYGKNLKMIYPLECLDTLDEIVFLGRKFKVPHNPEKYLEHMYGNWKTPLNRKQTKWYHRHPIKWSWKGKLNYTFPMTIAFYVNFEEKK